MKEKKHYKGVDSFNSHSAGNALAKVIERLPIWFLILGLLLRISFLSVIIPEIEMAFAIGKMSSVTKLAVIWVIPLLLEFSFTMASVANPSLFSHEETKKWAWFLLAFGGVGVAYNGIEMAFFVIDYPALHLQDSVNFKNHFLLQMANITSWVVTETAGFMLVSRGAKEMKQQAEQEELETLVENSADTPMPLQFRKLDSKRYFIKWSASDDVVESDIVKLQNALNSAKSRWMEKPKSKTLERSYNKWQLLSTWMAMDNPPIIEEEFEAL